MGLTGRLAGSSSASRTAFSTSRTRPDPNDSAPVQSTDALHPARDVGHVLIAEAVMLAVHAENLRPQLRLLTGDCYGLVGAPPTRRE